MGKKLSLQRKLEAEGWTLITNVSPSCETEMHDGDEWEVPFIPYGYGEVKKRFLSQIPNAKEIKVEEAYDNLGKPLPKMRAIYARLKES